MHEKLDQVRRAFYERFGEEPALVASAPGRVNLIGEHTDYMGGLVLPVAIDRETLIAISPSDDMQVRGYSLDFGEDAEVEIGHWNARHLAGWFRYVQAIASELQNFGIAMGGFRFVIGGNVPIGSGLSSSASVIVAAYKALQVTFDFFHDYPTAARICQRAENHFIGVQCGIMDPFISLAGRRDHALLLDCRDLTTEYLQARIPGYTWLIMDSKKRRGLVDSEYNSRRTQCQAGLDFLQKRFLNPSLHIRDWREESLEALQRETDPVVYRRLRHLTSENSRVVRAGVALRAGQAVELGRCLNGSHRSLRDDFEVSCPELDALAALLQSVPGALGARMTGAGFGGCVIALLPDRAVNEALHTVPQRFAELFPQQAQPVEGWPVRIGDGARIVASRSGMRSPA